jgi:hypothetical protein
MAVRILQCVSCPKGCELPSFYILLALTSSGAKRFSTIFFTRFNLIKQVANVMLRTCKDHAPNTELPHFCPASLPSTGCRKLQNQGQKGRENEMKNIRIAMLALAAVAVSACAGPQAATRNAVSASPNEATALTQPQSNTQSSVAKKSGDNLYIPDVNIALVTVSVPKTLKVSEKNTYYPNGDIIWRGDLFGDRHAQVEAILQNSAEQAAANLQGARPAHMHIQLTRFHGLTEKARYSTGGVHNINFYVTLLDPATGETIRPAEHVVTNLDALRGTEAIQADTLGNTQKFRITTFLAGVLAAEIGEPEGYNDENRGFFVALNRN